MKQTLIISIILQSVLGCFGRQAGPKIWHYVDKKGDIVEVMAASLYRRYVASRSLDEDATVHKRGSCSCYCRRKWEHEYVCCSCGDTTCFPAAATVQLETGQIRSVDNITVGEMIMTADTSGSVHPTEFLGYLQRESSIVSQYVVIRTDADTLRLSKSHIVYSSKDQLGEFVTRYAYEVQPNDYVIIRAGNHSSSSKVVEVEVKGMQGAYVPLTSSGTLLVDNTLVSNYASFPHTLAHVAMAPLRWFPWLLDATPTDGSHPYMVFMKQLGRSLLPGEWLFSYDDTHNALNVMEKLNLEDDHNVADLGIGIDSGRTLNEL